MSAPLLHLENATMQFGGLKCVSDLSFAVGADARSAWTGVVSVLLRDPRLLVY